MQLLRASLLTLFAIGLCCAQTSPSQSVLIPLIATDKHQHPVVDLAPAALVVREGKTPITGFTLRRGSELPLELGILIDTSNSERGSRLADILKASKDFVNDALRGPEDRVFFLTFTTSAQATPWLRKEQLAGISVNVRIGGGTALYDSVALACRERMGPRDWSKPRRRVLIVISDGDDNSSDVTRDQAASDALTSGAVIFTVGTTNVGIPTRGEKILKKWAQVTGGRSFTQLGRKESARAFATILQLIDGMYFLTYVPTASASKVHDVEVKPVRGQKITLSYPEKYLWVP